MKVDELTAKIEEVSGLELDTLPRMTGFSWFGADGKPLAIVVGQPFPINAGSTAYVMFQNDDVVRVYTLSRSAEKPSPPSRYTFTKTAPTFGAEVMSLDTFIDEIAEEWQEVAGLDDLDEIDLETDPDEVVGQVAASENNSSATTQQPAPATLP
jgi:hypothetical protein